MILCRRISSVVTSLALVTAPGLSHAVDLRGTYHISNAEMGVHLGQFDLGLRDHTFARASAIDRAEQNARVDIRDMVLKKGLGQAGHVAETLLLLWFIAVFVGIEQEHHYAPLTGEKPDFLGVVTRATDHTVNDFSLYVSMFTGGAAGLASGYPLSQLLKPFVNAQKQGLFQTGVLGAVFGTATNVGWELGSRLIQKSIADIALFAKTPAEREAAARDVKTALNLRFLKVLAGQASADENRVFGLILANAVERLNFIKNPLLTIDLAQDTLRLNILNGNFATMTLVFATSGALTGAIVGGPPGFLAGFAGTALGALALHYVVAERDKQRITDGVRRVRAHAAYNHLGLNADRLNTLAKVMGDWKRPIDPQSTRELEEILNERRGWRETLGTVLFEQIYDAVTEYQLATARLNSGAKIIPETKDRAELKKLAKLAKESGKVSVKSRRRALFYLNELMTMQNSDVDVLNSVLFSGQINSLAGKDLLERDTDLLIRVNKGLREMVVGFFPDQAAEMNMDAPDADQLIQLNESANVLVNVFYNEGFKESQFREKP